MPRRRGGKGGNRGKPKSFQPPAGAVILHCGHLGVRRQHWWYLGKKGREFTRPSGTKGTSEWLSACDPCFLVAKGQAMLVEVRGDGIWKAGPPLQVTPADIPQQNPGSN